MFARRWLIVVIAVCAAAVGVIVVMAAAGDDPAAPKRQMTAEQRWQKMLEKWDANGDGTLSKDECQGAEKLFERMDGNGDGVITQDEVRAAQAGQGQGGRMGQAGFEQRWKWMLQNWDANNDEQISQDEFKGPEAAFGRLDGDGDGVLTMQEAQQAMGRLQGQRADPAQRWQRMLQNWDANGDGQLSREEFKGADRAFQFLDADGDGIITEQEGTRAQGQQGDRPHLAQMLISMMDKDADGRVSQEESMAFFLLADADQDGFLTHDEIFEQVKQALRPKPAPAAAAGAGGEIPEPE